MFIESITHSAKGDTGAKIQRERLQDDFSKVLNNFQELQREAAEKERQMIEAARQDQVK